MNRWLSPYLLVLGLLFMLTGCGNNSPLPPEAPPATPPTSPPENPPSAPPPNPVIPAPPSGPPAPPPSSANLSGTVTAPSGGVVSGTLVAACADEACAAPTVTQVDASGAFTLIGLSTVPHVLIAIKDVDGNNVLNSGDYVGAYPSLEAPQTVTPPAADLDIVLIVYSDVGGPDLNPQVTRPLEQLDILLERP